MKKIIVLSFFLTVFLNACTAVPEDQNNGTTTPENVPVSDQVLDDEIFKRAASLVDQAECEDILGGEKREECKKVVTALQTTRKAKEDLSRGLCLEIDLERYRQNCETEVDQAITRANKVSELEKLSVKNQEIAANASEKKDVSLCNEIAEANQKSACRYNVLANQAIEENNKELCSDIGDSVFEEMCVSNFE